MEKQKCQHCGKTKTCKPYGKAFYCDTCVEDLAKQLAEDIKKEKERK